MGANLPLYSPRALRTASSCDTSSDSSVSVEICTARPEDAGRRPGDVAVTPHPADGSTTMPGTRAHLRQLNRAVALAVLEQLVRDEGWQVL